MLGCRSAEYQSKLNELDTSLRRQTRGSRRGLGALGHSARLFAPDHNSWRAFARISGRSPNFKYIRFLQQTVSICEQDDGYVKLKIQSDQNQELESHQPSLVFACFYAINSEETNRRNDGSIDLGSPSTKQQKTFTSHSLLSRLLIATLRLGYLR